MMEHKKDIGTLFEEKLQNKTAKPKSNLWEKIDTSLTQRAKVRPQTYWAWGVVTGILILAGILFSNIISDNNNNPSKQSSPLAIPVQNDLKTNKEFTVSKVDSVENEQLKKPVDSISKSSEKFGETTSISVDKKRRKSKVEHVKKGFDSFRKKTVYHYYNSKDSITIKTTNKALIDSLIKLEKTTIKIDSTN